ncbi:Kinesin-related protein 4 [Smittium mucronatum]|uniref:Kinesin-related protein 4 n=1 Tax=Smittium mucronatum TaxID=133383 RepID=A0A1R0H392_9FUNG|nr:Kinesin-related protein 4 [Smittium mucronatum]
MKDQINVVIRIRPLNERELNSIEDDESRHNSWSVSGNTISQKLVSDSRTNTGLVYTFDQIYSTDVKTEDIYDGAVKDIISSTMNGINGTVFAYGQTSSGKTYTMYGDSKQPGLINMAVKKVFEYIRDKEIFVKDSTEQIVLGPQEVYSLLSKGEGNRHIGCTNMNERSSRAHTIFRMVIESGDTIIDHDKYKKRLSESMAEGNVFSGSVKISTLSFVDLAGSERVGHTGAEGVRLREGAHINKSLLALGTVIARLSENGANSAHIPYRDSKLTRILQPSLGGNSRTSIICNITIAPQFMDETISTLKFASRAKTITNRPEVNEELRGEALLRRLNKVQILEKEIAEMQRIVSSKDDSLEECKKLTKELKWSEKCRSELDYENGLLKEEISRIKRTSKPMIELKNISNQTDDNIYHVQLNEIALLKSQIENFVIKSNNCDKIISDLNIKNEILLNEKKILESDINDFKIKSQDVQNDYKQKIESTNTQLLKTRSELEESNKRSDEDKFILVKGLDDLKSLLELERAKFSEIKLVHKQELISTNEICKELEAKNKIAQIKIINLDESLKNQKLDFTHEKSLLVEQITDLKLELEKRDSRIKHLEADFEEVSNLKSDFQKSECMYVSQISSLETEMESLNKELCSQKNDYQNIVSKLQLSDNRLIQCADSLKKTEKNFETEKIKLLENLYSKDLDFEDLVKKSNSELLKLEMKNNNQNQEIASLKEQIESKNTEFKITKHDFETKISLVDEKYKAIQEKYSESLEKIDHLSLNLSEQKKEFENEKYRVNNDREIKEAELTKNISQLENSIKKYEDQIEKLNSDIYLSNEQFNIELCSHKILVKKLEDQVCAKDQEYKDLELKLRKTQEESESLNLELKDAMSQFEKKNSDLKAEFELKICKLNENANELNFLLSKKDTELNDLREECENRKVLFETEMKAQVENFESLRNDQKCSLETIQILNSEIEVLKNKFEEEICSISQSFDAQKAQLLERLDLSKSLLESRESDLKDLRLEFKDSNHKFNTELENQTKELDSMHTKLESSQKYIEDLLNDNKLIKSKFEAEKINLLQNFDSNKSEILKKLEDKSSSLKFREEEFNQLELKASELKKDFEKRLGNKDEEVRVLELKLDDSRKCVNEKVKEIDILKSNSKAQLDKLSADFESERSELSHQIENSMILIDKKEMEFQNLKIKIQKMNKELEDEVSKKNKSLENENILSDKILGLKETINSLESKLSFSENLVMSLKSNLSELEAKLLQENKSLNSDLEIAKIEFSEKSVALKNEIDKKNRDINDLNEKLNELQSLVKNEKIEFESETVRLNNIIKEKIEIIDNLVKAAEISSLKLTEFETEIESLKIKSAQEKSFIKSSYEDQLSLKIKDIDELYDIIENIKDECKSHLIDLKNERNDLNNANIEIDDLKYKVSISESELSDQKSLYNKLKQEIDHIKYETSKERDNLLLSIENFKNSLSESDSMRFNELKSKEEEISELRSQVFKVLSDNNDLDKSLKKSKEDLNNMINKQKIMLEEHQNYIDNLNQARSEVIASLEIKLTALNDDLNKTREDLSTSKSDFVDLEKEFKTQTGILDSKIIELNDQIDSRDSEIMKLETIRSDLENSLDLRNVEYSNISKEHESQLKLINLKSDEISNFKNKLDSLLLDKSQSEKNYIKKISNLETMVDFKNTEIQSLISKSNENLSLINKLEEDIQKKSIETEDSINSANAAYEKIILELEESLDSEKKDNFEKSHEINKYLVLNESLNSQLSENKNFLDEKLLELEKLSDSNLNDQKIILKFRENESKLLGKIEIYNDDICQKELKIDNLILEMKNLEEQLEKLGSSHELLKEEMKKTVQTLEESEKEKAVAIELVEKTKSMMEEVLRVKDLQLEKLQNELEFQNEKITNSVENDYSSKLRASVDKIDSLQDEIDKNNETINTLKTQYLNIIEDNKKLIDEILLLKSNLENEASQKEESIKILEDEKNGEISYLRAELLKLNGSLKDLREFNLSESQKIKDLVSNHELNLRKIEDENLFKEETLLNIIEEKKRKISDIEKQLEEKIEYENQLNSEVVENLKIIDKYILSLDQKDKKIKSLENDLNEYRSRSEDNLMQIENITENLNLVKSELVDSKSHSNELIDKWKTHNTIYKGAFDTLFEVFASLQRAVVNFVQENSFDIELVVSNSLNFEELHTEISTIFENQHFSTEMDEGKKDDENNMQLLLSFRQLAPGIVTDLIATFDISRLRISGLENDIIEMKYQISTLIKNVEDLKSEISDTKKASKKYKDSSDDLRRSLNEAQKDLLNLKDSYSSLKSDKETEISMHRNQVVKKRDGYEKMIRVIKKSTENQTNYLKSVIDSLNMKLANSRIEVQDLTFNNNMIQTKLNQLKEKLRPGSNNDVSKLNEQEYLLNSPNQNPKSQEDFLNNEIFNLRNELKKQTILRNNEASEFQKLKSELIEVSSERDMFLKQTQEETIKQNTYKNVENGLDSQNLNNFSEPFSSDLSKKRKDSDFERNEAIKIDVQPETKTKGSIKSKDDISSKKRTRRGAESMMKSDILNSFSDNNHIFSIPLRDGMKTEISKENDDNKAANINFEANPPKSTKKEDKKADLDKNAQMYVRRKRAPGGAGSKPDCSQQ